MKVHSTLLSPIPILLVDDHLLFRSGLRRLFEDAGVFRVVGEAATAYEALALADQWRPAVVLLALQLRGVTGLQVVRLLKQQPNAPKVVTFSISSDWREMRAAFDAGADAFLARDCSFDELLTTLRQVATKSSTSMVSDAVGVPLSKREIEILDCMARGLSNKEIAEVLFISEQTVKNHMTRLFAKLDVRDRLQAVLWAIRYGWVDLDSPADRPSAA